MKSPHKFIVKPTNGERYSNTIPLGGIDFVVNTSEEDHIYSNREALVVEVPISYTGEIQKGDVLLVNHNVFKTQLDIRGNRKLSTEHIHDNFFFVEQGSYYGYKRDGKWNMIEKYCMVKPIETIKRKGFEKNIQEEPLIGEMRYVNKYLQSKGVKEGDRVLFTPDSEYEFRIDGERLYRMYDSSIAAIL
jgi:hypothetical protein